MKNAHSSTISSKGQITVPLEIRRRLGLKEGDRVEFIVKDELTVIRPARAIENPFEKYRGALPVFQSKTEVHKWIEDLRNEDPSD